MNTQEFFEQCNRSIESGTLLAGSKKMDMFGENVASMVSECNESWLNKGKLNEINEDMEKSDTDSYTNVDDFSDDFTDSFEEGANIAAGDRAVNDFEDNFLESIGENAFETITENVENLADLTIHSVQIQIKTLKSDSTIESEIKQFLIRHSSFPDSDTDLVRLWNQIYNDNLLSGDAVIEKYIKVHYGLWFTDMQALQEVLALGLDFLYQLKFDYRMCGLSDIRFIRECWRESWYDSNIINEFALDVNFVPLLIELMKNGKIDVSVMMRYRDDPDALLCCLRLLNADRFILGEFERAVNDKCIRQYTDAAVSGEKNKMQIIEHRDDFDDIKVKIRVLEGEGKIIDWDLVEKYRDAYYLGEIITASSEGRFNAEFVNEYLLEPLGKFSFIPMMYAENTVNVEVAPSNFMYSKIYTDAEKLDLNVHSFESYKGTRGLTCLICSRYAGSMSEADYRKFLAVLSLDKTAALIECLNRSGQLIESYSVFWMSQLLGQLDLSLFISKNIGDNILFVKFIDGRRRKYYLQIDDYVINQEKFMNLVNGSISCNILEDEKGIVLSNVFLTSRYQLKSKAKSSLTEWADKSVDKNLQIRYDDDNFILHTNFWKAIQNANERIKICKSGNRKLSRSVLDFVKMDIAEYYNYDKMFNYVSERQEFLGVFTSENAFVLLKLFSNAYVYHNVPQVMFMFLYVVLLKFSGDNFELYGEGFKDLDVNKTVLIADGLGINNTVINYRTISDSIDNLIGVAQNSQKVVLRVSEKTINLQFFK